MIRVSAGNLLMGGLVLTVFAKTATSFPAVQVSPDVLSPQLNVTVAAAAEEPQPEPEEAPPPVVTNLSPAPVQCETPEEILLSLTRERELVAQQRAQIDARESELVLAREKLRLESEALLELKASIEDLLERTEQAQTEDLERLIAFYENMKPAEAALIMDELDIEVTILVLSAMKPRVAAPILAKMSLVRARAVSKIILRQSQLPGDQNLVGVRLN